MAAELRTTVINMKTLDQAMQNPIATIGTGDKSGRKLRIIFTQEAAASFTAKTKVYLCWRHQELDILGYNIFTEIKNEKDKNFPPTWEITYPKSMLAEGHVLANIQLVDDVSTATSTNFIIHVLADPHDGFDSVTPDDPGSNDYETLINKPSIEGTTLIGDTTLQAIGIRSITEQDIDQIIYGVIGSESRFS